MDRLHIANINFEEELSGKRGDHPLFLQLEYLPFLYMQEGDAIFLSSPAPRAYLSYLERLKIYQGQKIYHPQNLPVKPYQIETWGPSQKILDWAKKEGHTYEIPSIETAKEIHTKHYLPLIEKAKAFLLQTPKELENWSSKAPYPKVLKEPFSLSSRGNYLVHGPLSSIQIEKLLKRNPSYRGEIWHKRHEDFSTLWEISKEGEILFIGATRLYNNERGSYQGSSTELTDLKETLIEHKNEARDLLEKIKQEGYFGILGLDAFTYEELGEKKQLISEINARKTMGYVALMLEKKFGRTLSMRFIQNQKEGLLPLRISDQSFAHQILVDFS